MGDYQRAAEILDELAQVLTALDEAALTTAAARVVAADRIFVAGAGRSGLAARMLAMRLAQTGLTVHVAGDATTPAIGAGDLLLVASGSGATAGMILLTEKAAAVGAAVLLVTHTPDSRLAALAGNVLLLPVPHDARRPGGLAGSQLLGSRFETALVIIGDLLVEAVCRQTGQTADDLQRRHANLE